MAVGLRVRQSRIFQFWIFWEWLLGEFSVEFLAGSRSLVASLEDIYRVLAISSYSIWKEK